EYIQEQAGDEAEVIFGHGVDSELGDRIRVTVIATGFATDGMIVPINKQTKEETRKVHDLDRTQTWLFSPDNSVNEKGKQPELKSKTIEEEKPWSEEKDNSQRETVFSGPFMKIEDSTSRNDDQDGEEGLFEEDDEFDTLSV